MPKSNHAIPNISGASARWSVHWVVPSGDTYRIVEIDCEDNLNEAIRIYTKAKESGKRFATLRSRNVAFPPDEKYRPYYAQVRDKRWVKGRRQKGITKYKTVHKVPMRTLNRKGVFWCPYCREMRKFQEQGAFMFEGIAVEAPGLYCPICGISHRDWHVRNWNPVCHRIYLDETRSRRGRGRRSRRGAR